METEAAPVAEEEVKMETEEGDKDKAEGKGEDEEEMGEEEEYEYEDEEEEGEADEGQEGKNKQTNKMPFITLIKLVSEWAGARQETELDFGLYDMLTKPNRELCQS